MPQADFSRLDDRQRAELWASLAMYELNGLGMSACARLVTHFGSPYRAVSNVQAWSQLGIKDSSILNFERGSWRAEARKNWDLVRESGLNVLLYNDPDFPELLKEIPDPPLMLFYLGDPSLLRNASVGVVGARDCTREGMSVAVDIVRGLSRAGITTISGMAKGIDRVVHLAGLEGPGSSIAVLGCGVDVPYPKANLDLYDLLKDKGLIISEFMPGTSPAAFNFPVRNRIISGLSRAVLVVEAAVRSGTLITARHAAEQGRDVYAVPGTTTADTSEGCRDLIRRGAKAVFTSEDILLELAPILKAELEEKLSGKPLKAGSRKALDDLGILPWDTASATQPKPEPARPVGAPLNQAELEKLTTGREPLECEILTLLNDNPNCNIDILCNTLQLDIARVSSALTMLEISGVVQRSPGMYYSISH